MLQTGKLEVTEVQQNLFLRLQTKQSPHQDRPPCYGQQNSLVSEVCADYHTHGVTQLMPPRGHKPGRRCRYLLRMVHSRPMYLIFSKLAASHQSIMQSCFWMNETRMPLGRLQVQSSCNCTQAKPVKPDWLMHKDPPPPFPLIYGASSWGDVIQLRLPLHYFNPPAI